jgi:antitoxin component YwqK of YwqJK toxin-antitoxin module
MKRLYLILLTLVSGCHYNSTVNQEPLSFIQIQDRNGLMETINSPDRLAAYESVDFLSSQPYKKVLRVYKKDGNNYSKISTYHPNGMLFQYLEAKSMRAHGAYREWFSNGQLKIDANVVGGTADLGDQAQDDWLFDGINQVWDEQGNLIAKISYQKGVLEGPSLYFYPSGSLERQLLFSKNLIEKEAIEFFPSGQIKSRSNYSKGLKNGETLIFQEEGKLIAKEFYKDGLLFTGTYYNLEGEILSEIENGGGFQTIFDNGNMTLIEFKMGKPEGMVKQFNPFNELRKSFFLKSGKKFGEEIEFYSLSEIEGTIDKNSLIPKYSVQWNDNMIHGTVKTWYPNGQLQSQREYARNKKNGPALAWYRNGALMLVEEYEEDLLQCGQYFKMNKSESISTIVNGNGTATLYDEMGSFLRKVSYMKGKPLEP